MNPSTFGAKRMLMAGHIKPWRHCAPRERLDPRNGLAACPAHDVAFDTGLIAINGALRIDVSRRLADAVDGDRLARQYFGRPPLLNTLLMPESADLPTLKYIDWHRTNIYLAASPLPRTIVDPMWQAE